jgi:hypothetical protein
LAFRVSNRHAINFIYPDQSVNTLARKLASGGRNGVVQRLRKRLLNGAPGAGRGVQSNFCEKAFNGAKSR